VCFSLPGLHIAAGIDAALHILQEGSNREARWRRALLAVADEDDEVENAPHVEKAHMADDQPNLSDEEDQEALNYFKQQKLLKDSQVERRRCGSVCFVASSMLLCFKTALFLCPCSEFLIHGIC
jgi:hypothetical protein